MAEDNHKNKTKDEKGQMTDETEIYCVMTQLAELGENNASVEYATGITRRTLRRWRAGTHQPQRKSDIALLKAHIERVKQRKNRGKYDQTNR